MWVVRLIGAPTRRSSSPQPRHRPRLDLPRALTRDADLVAALLERPGLTPATEPVPPLDDPALAPRQAPEQHSPGVARLHGRGCTVGRRREGVGQPDIRS